MTNEQIESIIDQFDFKEEFFVWQMEGCEDLDEDQRLEKFLEEEILCHLDEDEEKVLALMEHTGDNWDDAENQIDTNYIVLTDNEADNEADRRLDNYLEDCVLSQIPDTYHYYFNCEEWKSDNDSDRGSWLSSVDGSEWSEEINGTTYYIYKQ